MFFNCYSLFDNKALTWSPPFHVNTDGAAIRMVGDIANDLNTQIGRHPSDFSLFQVGTFSDSNGSLEPAVPVRHVIDAIALITIKPKGDLFSRTNGTVTADVDEPVNFQFDGDVR